MCQALAWGTCSNAGASATPGRPSTELSRRRVERDEVELYLEPAPVDAGDRRLA